MQLHVITVTCNRAAVCVGGLYRGTIKESTEHNTLRMAVPVVFTRIRNVPNALHNFQRETGGFSRINHHQRICYCYQIMCNSSATCINDNIMTYLCFQHKLHIHFVKESFDEVMLLARWIRHLICE